MTRCTYGLLSGGLIVECGAPATTHIVGSGSVARGLDIEGTKQVDLEGNYCDKHSRTVKNRLDSRRVRPLV